ncbi:MAG: HDOD domain-containing protein [Desulfovibrio sp.]|nr:HDOD domain-containing protein [Desulfovibrio sp.]
MIRNEMSHGNYEQVFVARQPVFTRKGTIYGYELLFRSGEAVLTARFPDEDLASSKVLVDGIALAAENVPENARFFFNFTQSMLLNESALTLPQERCVIEILERVPPQPSVLEACSQLRHRGYTLALDDYYGDVERAPFLDVVDMVKVDIRALQPPLWGQVLEDLKGRGLVVVAEKVETWAEYRELKALGYDFFQGFFFSRPEIVPGRKLSSGMAAKVKLLKILGDPNARPEDIPGIIEADPGLSLRLLKFINSAVFAFRSKISSIPHAMALMGLEPLRRWSMVVVVSDMDESVKGQELSYLSLQRARFLELLAGECDAPPLSPGGMFLLGLFSQIDAMLGMPLKRILEGMVLEDALLQALLGEECPACEWLHMVESLERGDWRTAGAVVARWGIPGRTAARCHLEAATWAGEKIWTLRQHD